MVARHTLIPPADIRSMTLSSQPKSYSPGADSVTAQPKIPTDTMVTPAAFIRATSESHTASGHCSGL
jgi:hypothetical protein